MIQMHEITMVNVAELKVDESYQRPLDPTRVKKMSADYRPELEGTIVVSVRGDGSKYVVDGWHRVTCARTVDQQYSIGATVHHGLTVQQEADLFRMHNENRKPVTALDDYRACLVVGVPDAVAVREVLTSLGMDVGTSASATKVQAVLQLRSIVRMGNSIEHGKALLEEVLTIINEAWPVAPGPDKWNNQILKGLAVFLVKYEDATHERTVKRLSKVTPSWLLANGKALSGAKSQPNVALAVLNEYNHGLTKPLPYAA
jgi:hypothetical protein